MMKNPSKLSPPISSYKLNFFAAKAPFMTNSKKAPILNQTTSVKSSITKKHARTSMTMNIEFLLNRSGNNDKFRRNMHIDARMKTVEIPMRLVKLCFCSSKKIVNRKMKWQRAAIIIEIISVILTIRVFTIVVVLLRVNLRWRTMHNQLKAAWEKEN